MHSVRYQAIRKNFSVWVLELFLSVDKESLCLYRTLHGAVVLYINASCYEFCFGGELVINVMCYSIWLWQGSIKGAPAALAHTVSLSSFYNFRMLFLSLLPLGLNYYVKVEYLGTFLVASCKVQYDVKSTLKLLSFQKSVDSFFGKWASFTFLRKAAERCHKPGRKQWES